MNIIIVDDEPLALKMLANAVSEAVPEAEIAAYSKPREALEYAERAAIQIAFLDINMQLMSGLEMARRLKKICAETNIVFSTGYEKYALDAHKLFASGYLLKPISADDVREVMENLRFPAARPKRLSFRCFGNFEAYCDGKPIRFKLSRTKEMLAYLVDRNGAQCSSSEIISVLFENANNMDYYQKLRSDLIKTFRKLGLSDCITVTHGGISVNREKADCDYFDIKDGKISEKPAEYMSQFSFSEYTMANLLECGKNA